MTVPDGVAISAIAAIAGYFAWQNKAIVKSYFEQIPRQTQALEKLTERFDEHDKLTLEAHENSCKTLKEMTRVLKSLRTVQSNGKNKPKIQEANK
jgi:hypothetical protein